MTESKRVGIVGCGYIAGFADDSGARRHIYTHAKAIAQPGSGARLVACCDNSPEQLAKFGERWGIERRYSRLEEMLKNENLDILTIATPTTLHRENVLEGLKTPPRAIFCEKPLADSLAASRELVEAADAAGIPLAVNFMRRWDPFYRECLHIVRSGSLGRLETVVAYVDTALLMNSIHMLDLVIHFAGAVELAVGQLDRKNEIRVVHGKADPGGYAFIRHRDGVISFVKATGESRRNHYFELDLQFTAGRLRILDDDRRYEIHRFKECPDKNWLSMLELEKTVPNVCAEERVVSAYANIAASIDRGEPLACSGAESLRVMELIELIHESDRLSQQPVMSNIRE